jgi:hypothetical protein
VHPPIAQMGQRSITFIDAAQEGVHMLDGSLKAEHQNLRWQDHRERPCRVHENISNGFSQIHAFPNTTADGASFNLRVRNAHQRHQRS